MNKNIIERSLSTNLKSVLNRLVDRKTGLIKQLVEIGLQSSEPGLYIFSAECSDTRYAIDLNHSIHGRAEQIASGAALDPEEALWSTIGEACERFIASYFFEDQTVYASQNSLRNNFTQLESFIGFSDSQYDKPNFFFHKPNPEKEIHWARGFDLETNELVYLPAQLVWLGFPSKFPSEKLFPQISTGLAAGSSLEHAVLTGLREVIERDSFTTHWLLKRTPKKIRLDDICNKHQKIKELLKKRNHEVHLLWMDTDINIPCVACVIRLPGKAGIALGMSCHLDSVIAAEKAIVEAFHTYNWIQEMRRRGLQPTKEEEISDFEHHIRFYFEPLNHDFIEFMLCGDYIETKVLYNNQFSHSDYKVQINEVLTRIRKAGYKSYAVDISKREFLDLNIYAAKAIVPGLQPLHVGIGSEFLDKRRLEKVSRSWGIKFPDSLNLAPHPFP